MIKGGKEREGEREKKGEEPSYLRGEEHRFINETSSRWKICVYDA